jgi:hypothetical protein
MKNKARRISRIANDFGVLAADQIVTLRIVLDFRRIVAAKEYVLIFIERQFIDLIRTGAAEVPQNHFIHVVSPLIVIEPPDAL